MRFFTRRTRTEKTTRTKSPWTGRTRLTTIDLYAIWANHGAVVRR